MFSFKIYKMGSFSLFHSMFFSFNYMAFFLFFFFKFIFISAYKQENFIGIIKYPPYGQPESNSDYFSQISVWFPNLLTVMKEKYIYKIVLFRTFLVFSLNSLILDFLWYIIYAVLPKNINKVRTFSQMEVI